MLFIYKLRLKFFFFVHNIKNAKIYFENLTMFTPSYFKSIFNYFFNVMNEKVG